MSNIREILESTQSPEELFIAPVKWKYLVRAIKKGKNLMLLGPSGTGKSFAIGSAAKALGHNVEKFNMGQSQDPQSFLCGTLHLVDKQTKYVPSRFAEAIQVPNNVIMLDEITRKHPDAGNILMTILDEDQKYMTLDNHPDRPVIKVAEGVSFIATGNVGSQYTSTRKMDKALYDRFEVMEMDLLTDEKEADLIVQREAVEKHIATAIAQFMGKMREYAADPADVINNVLGHRISLRMANLHNDGFSLMEACEVAVFPMFSEEGAEHSERYKVSQLAQTIFGAIDGDGAAAMQW